MGASSPCIKNQLPIGAYKWDVPNPIFLRSLIFCGFADFYQTTSFCILWPETSIIESTKWLAILLKISALKMKCYFSHRVAGQHTLPLGYLAWRCGISTCSPTGHSPWHSSGHSSLDSWAASLPVCGTSTNIIRPGRCGTLCELIRTSFPSYVCEYSETFRIKDTLSIKDTFLGPKCSLSYIAIYI